MVSFIFCPYGNRKAVKKQSGGLFFRPWEIPFACDCNRYGCKRKQIFPSIPMPVDESVGDSIPL